MGIKDWDCVNPGDQKVCSAWEIGVDFTVIFEGCAGRIERFTREKSWDF